MFPEMMHRCLGENIVNTNPPPPELVEELDDPNEEVRGANEVVSGTNNELNAEHERDVGESEDISVSKHDHHEKTQNA